MNSQAGRYSLKSFAEGSFRIAVAPGRADCGTYAQDFVCGVVFERRTGPGLGTFGQEGELIYVTSQGSQLAVEALELALESFAQPCFACRVSTICFGMVRAWIETILHVFETFFVCWSVGRSVRLSVVPSGPLSELCGRLECL